METYSGSYTINGKPIIYEELEGLRLHNVTMQAICDAVNARLEKAGENKLVSSR